MADIDNLKGGTKRVVEETAPLNNLRGGTKRVVIVDGGGGGGGASYTAGTGIDITSGVISVKTPVTSTGVGGLTAGDGYSTTDAQQWITRFGRGTQTTGAGSSAFGNSARATGKYSIALGASAYAYANYAIQLGIGTNSDANTFKVALSNNSNYELLSSDGTVPTARLTKVNTTATLAVADWSSSTQTVTVSGVKADSVVFVSPAPSSASDYASAGILCTAQAADSLTFTCTTTPSNAITVNVICM